jgi:AmmeMemoRadiSam system protein A
MVPMSSSNAAGSVHPEHKPVLLSLARDSIRHGLTHGRPLLVDLTDYGPEFSEPRATFVTLHMESQLRGCIGSLEAHRPLAADVAHNAFAAAFRDPRFPPLSPPEFDRLELHLSLLTPAQPLIFDSETDLLGQLVVGKDGLILVEGSRRGTFLPAVWESLPDPLQFLEHLKLKAGLPRGYWSDTVQVWRYRAEVIE